MVKFNKKIYKFLAAIVTALCGILNCSMQCNAADVVSTDSSFEVNDDGVLMAYSGDSDTVVIPENVKSISFGVFMDHSEIKNIEFPKNLIGIDECAFYGCNGLKTVVLPDYVEHIGRLAFGNCRFLDKIYIDKAATGMLELITYGCPNLEKIDVDIRNTAYASIGGILYTKLANVLVSCPQNYSGKLTIPDSVVTIREYAFFDCDKIDEVALGSGVKYVDEASFYGCKNLKSIDLTGDVKKVRSYSFAECSSLTNVTLGENVNYIGHGAFFKCPNLKIVTFLSSEVKFGEDVFEESGDLTIRAPKDSSAQAYAQEHGYKFELID